MKSKKNLPMTILGIVFLAVGAVLLITGVIFGVVSYRFTQHANIIDATIIEIDAYRHGANDRNSNIRVQYEVEGQVYDKVLDCYSSSWYEGKVIQVYCDKNNVHDVRPKSIIYLVTFILGGIGGIFFILGIFFQIINARRKRRTQWLLDNGTRKYGEITGITFNQSVQVNRRIPYYFVCTVRDEYTGNQINYKSDPLWVRPLLFHNQNYGNNLQKYIGQQVIIYVNPNKPKQYHVDLDMDEIANGNIDL